MPINSWVPGWNKKIWGLAVFVPGILLTDTFLLAKQSGLHPLGAFVFGMTQTAGYLFTLDSPNSNKGCGGLYDVTVFVSWVVSFFGWMVIPVTVGVIVGRSQAQRTLLSDIDRGFVNVATDAAPGDPTKQKEILDRFRSNFTKL